MSDIGLKLKKNKSIKSRKCWSTCLCRLFSLLFSLKLGSSEWLPPANNPSPPLYKVCWFTCLCSCLTHLQAFLSPPWSSEAQKDSDQQTTLLLHCMFIHLSLFLSYKSPVLSRFRRTSCCRSAKPLKALCGFSCLSLSCNSPWLYLSPLAEATKPRMTNPNKQVFYILV